MYIRDQIKPEAFNSNVPGNIRGISGSHLCNPGRG